MFILESEPGQHLYVISDFWACEERERFSWDHAIHFPLGSEVIYCDIVLAGRDFYDRQPIEKWCVLFEFDGKRFKAVASCFISESIWRQLLHHFSLITSGHRDLASPSHDLVLN